MAKAFAILWRVQSAGLKNGAQKLSWSIIRPAAGNTSGMCSARKWQLTRYRRIFFVQVSGPADAILYAKPSEQ